MWNRTIAPVPAFIPSQYIPPTWGNNIENIPPHSQIGALVYHQATPLDSQPPPLEILPKSSHDSSTSSKMAELEKNGHSS